MHGPMSFSCRETYGSKEKEMEVFSTKFLDAQRTSLCHSTHLDNYGQKDLKSGASKQPGWLGGNDSSG